MVLSDKNKCYIFLNENLVITYGFCHLLNRKHIRKTSNRVWFHLQTLQIIFEGKKKKGKKEEKRKGKKDEGEKEGGRQQSKAAQYCTKYNSIKLCYKLYFRDIFINYNQQ